MPIKIPMIFFTEIQKKSYNSVGNTKDPELTKQSQAKREILEVLF
jgi:hypothetical protein